MSLVSIVATEQFVSVVTDGRSMQNGEISREDYPKFRQYSNIFIAYAGTSEVAEIILTILENEGVIKRGNLFEVAAFVEAMIHSEQSKRFKTLFAIGGVSLEGQIVFITMDSQNAEVNRFAPEADQVSYIVFCGRNKDVSAKALLKEGLERVGHVTPLLAVLVQEQLISLVSEKDKTVNKVIFKTLIER